MKFHQLSSLDGADPLPTKLGARVVKLEECLEEVKIRQIADGIIEETYPGQPPRMRTEFAVPEGAKREKGTKRPAETGRLFTQDKLKEALIAGARIVPLVGRYLGQVCEVDLIYDELFTVRPSGSQLPLGAFSLTSYEHSWEFERGLGGGLWRVMGKRFVLRGSVYGTVTAVDKAKQTISLALDEPYSHIELLLAEFRLHAKPASMA